MKIIYQRANCDSSGNICYLGCCYESLYNLKAAIHDLPVITERVVDVNREWFEDVRGSWPARIETADRVILETIFFPVLAFKTPYDDKEITLGYIEHIIY